MVCAVCLQLPTNENAELIARTIAAGVAVNPDWKRAFCGFETVTRIHKGKVYKFVLLHRTCGEDGKVKHETIEILEVFV
mgnify:FL=1